MPLLRQGPNHPPSNIIRGDKNLRPVQVGDGCEQDSLVLSLRAVIPHPIRGTLYHYQGRIEWILILYAHLSD